MGRDEATGLAPRAALAAISGASAAGCQGPPLALAPDDTWERKAWAVGECRGEMVVQGPFVPPDVFA